MPEIASLHPAPGRSRIKLKSTGEVFTLVPPNVKANNVIVGSTWIDNDGDFSLVNTTTGARVSMYFTPCGWFGSGRYQVRRPPGYHCREHHVALGTSAPSITWLPARSVHYDLPQLQRAAVPGAVAMQGFG